MGKDIIDFYVKQFKETNQFGYSKFKPFLIQYSNKIFSLYKMERIKDRYIIYNLINFTFNNLKGYINIAVLMYLLKLKFVTIENEITKVNTTVKTDAPLAKKQTQPPSKNTKSKSTSSKGNKSTKSKLNKKDDESASENEQENHTLRKTSDHQIVKLFKNIGSAINELKFLLAVSNYILILHLKKLTLIYFSLEVVNLLNKLFLKKLLNLKIICLVLNYHNCIILI